MRTMSGGPFQQMSLYLPCLHYDCSNRNSFGYCKTTACINEHYQQEQYGLPSTTNKCESVVIKQQTKTNGDKMRAMSDEELAKIIGENIDCKICKKMANNNGLCPGSIINIPGELDCYDVWLKWLKKEVEE